MEKDEIIQTFKASTNKLETIDKIVAASGKEAIEVIKILIEGKIDGRIFRQGRYGDIYREAKKMVIEESVAAAGTATASLKGEIENLKKENEELKARVESYERCIRVLEKEKTELSAKVNESDDAEDFDKLRTLYVECQELQRKAERFILDKMVYGI